MNKELENIIKNLSGSLIGIGIKEENLINKIEKNNKILECNLLDCFEKEEKIKGRNKKVKIKKIRKKFGKRKTNYIICNYQRIKEFKDKFIYDSIYLCNNEIYVYGDELDENLIRRYCRFSEVQIKNIENKKLYIIKINKNMNKINEIYNKSIDSIISAIDFISNLLT